MSKLTMFVISNDGVKDKTFYTYHGCWVSLCYPTLIRFFSKKPLAYEAFDKIKVKRTTMHVEEISFMVD